MVQCSDSTLYTGVTTNIDKRLHDHNATKAGARYTRVRRPVILVYLEPASDRGTAQRREAVLRKSSREDKLAAIALYKKAQKGRVGGAVG